MIHLLKLRYLLAAVGAIVQIHFILSFVHKDYGQVASFQNLKHKWASATCHDEPDGKTYSGTRKANATFVILARNSDAQKIVESLKQMEDRFNKKFGYPYVFLNDEPFSEEFIRMTTNIVSTKTSYGTIPREHWVQPDWIDEDKAAQARKQLLQDQPWAPYSESVSYRNMCRFYSGFFFRHELLKNYEFYWRIEPEVTFYCDLDYDPFLFMKDNDKVYSFTISLREFRETIWTLWDTTKSFIKANPQYVAENNTMAFLSDDEGESYNLCHFWSNFEIVNMDFWRSEAYMKYFEYLEASGGFYYERWGDAPIHSIAASLFLRKDQIHFFNDIGYNHFPHTHCPSGEVHKKGKCWCDPIYNFDTHQESCMPIFQAAQKS